MPIHPRMFERMKRQQRAHWPDGHIRIGDSVPTEHGVRPRKLSTFRFTSPSRPLIEAAADLYGGTVAEMTRGMDKWQVTTTADEIPVLLPPHSVTQWMEYWDGPYCERRCDGETIEQKSGRPCLCRAEGRLRCTVKTRLSVLLQDVPSLGTWLLVSGGLNAAEDLPDRAAFIERAGDYIDAILLVTETRTLKDGKPVTFPVPRLRVEGISPRQLMTGTVPARSELARRNAPALPRGHSTQPPDAPDEGDPSGQTLPDYLALAAAATTPERIRVIWRQALEAGHLTPELRTVLNTVGAALTARQQEPAGPEGVDEAPAGKHDPAETPAAPDPAESDAIPGPTPQVQAEWLRHQILHSWPGGLTELHDTFHAMTGTTMRRANLDQLQTFATTLHRQLVGEQDHEVVDADLIEDQQAAHPAAEGSRQDPR
ncbi:hypothetical protein ACQEUU_33985 [Nonomuraea sp. CA-218870]|uniref:PE-PGRS family protein n=1 Tax=Nonomuraea corallina TaxID=2989783 RepID=A0ABT4SI57_9ACTN|nr:hypothetical protein [Nonomuraea corallina]MDA0636635.1 hypothetical protein [Nonomuraea corallina]